MFCPAFVDQGSKISASPSKYLIIYTYFQLCMNQSLLNLQVSPNPGLPRGDLGCLGIRSSLLPIIMHKKKLFEGATHLFTSTEVAETDQVVIPDHVICISVLDVNKVCAGILCMRPVFPF